LICAVTGFYLVRICFVEGTPAAPKTDLKSQIYRWEQGRFVGVEEFPTFGGTDAATFEADGSRYLAVSNSLTADIRFRQDTVIYKSHRCETNQRTLCNLIALIPRFPLSLPPSLGAIPRALAASSLK
jgi:hypothetical protein